MRKLTAFVVLTATGCQSWRVQSEPAPAVVSERHPKFVRLILKSGGRIELTDARVEGDSIVGRLTRGNPSRQRVAVATADVERISTQYTSAVKSLFAVAAIVVAVGVIAGASAASSASSNTGSSCSSTGVAAPAA